MDNGHVAAGTRREIDGQWRIFFEGYWVKIYDVPADTLLAKKRLIEALTRRLFNHVEHGINIPGTRLDEARLAYDRELHPQRRRVKAAMLAGCLFNRAADVFTKLVELQAIGAAIHPDNALMRQCEEHLQEALVLGKMVLHRSGDEGIDEMWGEPFKAFAFPIEDFYRTRYLKIATTMKAIDRIADELVLTFEAMPAFTGIETCIRELARAARLKCETLRTDADIFDVWAAFAVAADNVSGFTPLPGPTPTPAEHELIQQGLRLLHEGRNLVFYMTRARVPMPKSTREFLERCERFRERLDRRERPVRPVAARAENAVSASAP
jgi:hypothetical protein